MTENRKAIIELIEPWEEFRDCHWYEDLYLVSNYGRVMSLNFSRTWKPKILKEYDNWLWYKRVALTKDKELHQCYVHRLVLESIKRELWKECNHIDWDKSNNRVENLEYCTRSENIKHRNDVMWYKYPKWIESTSSKSVKQYSKELIFIRYWDCIKDIERELWIFWTNITACCKWRVKSAGGYKWNYNITV